MSTSLHYLCSTANIHLQQLVLTSADRSLVYLVKNNMTTSSWRASTGHSSVMTSTSRPESTSTTFRSRTSLHEIYNCNNLRMRRTLSNLRVFNLQSYDIILKQLHHNKNNNHQCYNHHQVYLNHLKHYYLDTYGKTTSSTTSSCLYFKDHLRRYKQFLYLLHLQQYIVQQESTTTILVDLHQKQLNIIDIPHEDYEHHQALLGSNLVDISVDSGILQVATNIDKKEQQLQEDLIKQTIELQDFYEDDLSQHTEDDIKAAIASELHSLGKKNIYGEVDIDSLTAEQRRIIKTRWVMGPRPSSTSVDDIDDTTTGPLKASCVAKRYSQHISDHIKETFAATPSSTSLRTLLLHAVLHQYQVTSCDISSAFLNTPIEETSHVQPPPEVYQHRPRVIWKLHRALYGLRTSPKMWQEHLHSTLRGLHLQQLKADRCVCGWSQHNGFGLRRWFAHRRNIKGDIIVSGATSTIFQLETLNSPYHTTTTSLLGHPNGDMTLNLERSYYYSMLKHMDLDENINPTSTPSLRRPPVQQGAQLDPDRHRNYRKVVGMLMWASLVLEWVERQKLCGRKQCFLQKTKIQKIKTCPKIKNSKSQNIQKIQKIKLKKKHYSKNKHSYMKHHLVYTKHHLVYADKKGKKQTHKTPLTVHETPLSVRGQKDPQKRKNSVQETPLSVRERPLSVHGQKGKIKKEKTKKTRKEKLFFCFGFSGCGAFIFCFFYGAPKNGLISIFWPVLTLVRPDLQFTAKDHTRHLTAPTEWDWTHLKQIHSGTSREHSTTSSSSHLGYLKDTHYHFDSSSRCTSTHTVILTGPLTSSHGSLPQAQSHQYLEYLLHSTAEHSLQLQHRVRKPNSTPSASASATAIYTSTSYFKNFNNIFNDQPSTSAMSTLCTTLLLPQHLHPWHQQSHRFTSSQTAHQHSVSATSLASTKGPSTSRWDTSSSRTSRLLDLWTSRGLHLTTIRQTSTPSVSHREFWSDIFVTTASLNCTSKRGDQLLPHPWTRWGVP